MTDVIQVPYSTMAYCQNLNPQLAAPNCQTIFFWLLNLYALNGVHPMQITLDLPEELIQHFDPNDLSREILASLVIQAYQTEKITSAEVGRILGLSSRWAVSKFLKQHNAELHYDETDLEQDRETLRQLREHQVHNAP